MRNALWLAPAFVLIVIATGLASLTDEDANAGPAGPVVNSTDDDTDPEGCDATHCSLREAILEASNNNVPDKTNDTISFDIPGAGPHIIQPAQTLPALGDANLTVDGYTQTDASASTASAFQPTNADIRIVLDGSMIPEGDPGGEFGLWVGAGGITIRGLSITNFGDEGIKTGTFPTSTVIRGNYIGLRPDGTTVGPNNIGVDIRSSESGNTVGGPAPADRNVISGNAADGVHLWGSTAVLVQNNFVGTNATGDEARPNGGNGIYIAGAVQSLIGDSSGNGNLVSGNAGDGVFVASTEQVTISGNRAGTNAAGTMPVPNGGHGIHLAAAHFGTVGGSSASGGNLASGNAMSGVALSLGTGQANVKGNLIGVALDGVSPLPNSGSGVLLDSTANNNTIGGEFNQAEQNIIAFNAGAGVALTASASINNYIDPSKTHSNGGLGTDLLNDGLVLPNDVDPTGPNDDSDVGANELMNYPVITSATHNGTTLTLNGYLDSVPGDFYNLFAFSNSECDPSGYGEGKTFLGSFGLTTGPDGHGTFARNFTVPGIGNEIYITTSASNPESTSEYSRCEEIEFTGPTLTSTQPPTPTHTPTSTPTPSPTSLASPTATPCPSSALMLGDVDGDGEIAAADATLVLEYIALNGSGPVPGVCPTGLRLGDVDCDGDLTVLDVLTILYHAAEVETTPVPTCAV